MSIKQILTDKAPAAIGPYSQAVVVQGIVYTSGQIPIIPETGIVLKGSIEDETHQVMKNLKALLEAAGSSLENTIKTTIFITDMAMFGRINEVYGSYFPKHRPARSCVEVSHLPKDVSIEIEAVALVS